MLTLAIENSYGNFSAALMYGHDSIGAVEESVDSRNVNRLFGLIDQLIGECAIERADIERYVVGRGPGNYSGMRSAFSIAQGMALPRRAELIAVSSGAAIAWRVFRECDCSRVAVIGDARRGRYWAGVFSLESTGLVVEKDWELFTIDELSVAVQKVHAVASPEMEALVASHQLEFAAGARLAAENIFPCAIDLASIASVRRDSGQSDEPFEPLYMHPAV